MKRLLLLLLASIALPTAVSAESFDARLARRQLPKIQKLTDNVLEFYKMRDYEAACSKQREHNFLVKQNFEGLQEIAPNYDWFAIRKESLELEDIVCSKR